VRNGKIAELPVGARMENGEAGALLLECLSGLPEAQESLKAHFGGKNAGQKTAGSNPVKPSEEV
jgi:hypothetical protein